MDLIFANLIEKMILKFTVQLILTKKFGRDVGGLVFSFLDEPEPFSWDDEPCLSPWDPLIDVPDMIALPLFAP